MNSRITVVARSNDEETYTLSKIPSKLMRHARYDPISYYKMYIMCGPTTFAEWSIHHYAFVRGTGLLIGRINDDMFSAVKEWACKEQSRIESTIYFGAAKLLFYK